jgi:hypothetical protein
MTIGKSRDAAGHYSLSNALQARHKSDREGTQEGRRRPATPRRAAVPERVLRDIHRSPAIELSADGTELSVHCEFLFDDLFRDQAAFNAHWMYPVLPP